MALLGDRGIEGTGADEPEAARLRLDLERLKARFPAYPNRYLYILMAVGAVDAADRSILATVMEDVKRAFSVSDSQLGMLGAAYAVVATLSAIPFGFLADRWHRVRLIALGFVPWGVSMILTGAATSFGMMFGARLLLGSIEATNGPSTPSLLGDYYPVSRRSRMFGTYGIGALLGTLAGFGFAGIIASIFDWRMSFYIWGVAALGCGLVVARALPEPERGIPDAIHGTERRLLALERGTAPPEPAKGDAAGDAAATTDYRTISVRDAARALRGIPTLWIALAASAAGDFLTSGLYLWAPTFFRRYHGQSAAGGGIVTALLALSLVAGIIVGSKVGDRAMAEGVPNRRLWLTAGANIGVAAALLPAFAIHTFPPTVPLFLLAGIGLGLPMAPQQAMSLDIVVPRLRGRAAALRSVVRAGMTALAPLVFGVLSDHLGLRAAFLIVTPCMVLSAGLTLLALRTYVPDMERAQSEALRQHRLEDDSTR